jgi:hypothetical protein
MERLNKIDELKNKIDAERYSVFDFDRPDWQQRILVNFNELCFLGQLEKDNLYVTMLHQVLQDNCPQEGEGEGVVRNLSLEEMNEFYLTGDISSLQDAENSRTWKPFTWTFWFINMEKKYVKVFTSFQGGRCKSPKENYGDAYEMLETKVVARPTDNKVMHEWQIDFNPMFKEVLEKLIDIVQYSKTHEIVFADFDKKVHQDMRKYWGMINNKGFVDDEYVETMPAEVIKIPFKHEKVLIRQDTTLTNNLKGEGYLEINFPKNGIIRSFKTLRELNNYYFSLVEFINDNNETLNVKQKINSVEKHYLSNKWPIANNDEEAEENKKKYTLYKISAQKFGKGIVVQADVQEYGICYTLTNFWDHKFCEHF